MNDDFSSDQEKGVYYWKHDFGEGPVQFSSHPHPKLPYHCEPHRWYSEKPCTVKGHPPQVEKPRRKRRFDQDEETPGEPPKGF